MPSYNLVSRGTSGGRRADGGSSSGAQSLRPHQLEQLMQGIPALLQVRENV
ncbi:hypothetical protein P378_16040 [Desulforamulus profundi]|uniref:Uncharacterized protein n=1 Tax=Desulforamulus profundi TaxID=1383067 RepID=A0A2C6MDV9_9FIRM|nr:hypothetical protein [Desulforamulus profundi]PHJ37486.1 hypothetical protein P378_16040 [Desulforamulus profundi]